MQKVRKAIIAAAGFGTRFLPQTKAMPKEMLPVVDKPIIQYIVEQLVEAGVTDIIIVTGYSKRSIEDHFDAPNEDLVNNLRAGGPSKEHFIRELEEVANIANFAYVRQKGPYGNATPLMSAAHLIGDEPFMYIFADDITVAKPNGFKQMVDMYNELGGSILSCIKVQTDKEFKSYGILGGEQIRDDVIEMSSIIEKPGREKAPSNFANVGNFLLTPDTLDYLEKGFQNLEPGKEFYLTDSILQPMISDGKKFFGYIVHNSRRYDTGDKLGYLKAVVDFALEREDVGDDFREYLRSIRL